MEKVVIVGAGAMGCLFATRLAEAGASVTLVDVDAARLALIGSEGIALSDDEGERVVHVNAAIADEVCGSVDLLMLFTKGMHSAAAVGSVAHLADSTALALTLQNGLGNAEVLAGVFDPARVLMGVTDFPADLKGPARVASHGIGQTRLGGFTPEAQAGADQVAALLSRAKLNAVVDGNIEVAVWEKVAFNAALNSLASVTGLTVGGMNSAPCRRIAEAIVGEVAATAIASGIAIDRDRIAAKIDFALVHHGQHQASMLQDRLAGRATEIESINGAIVRQARRLGISTPVTATLADMVRSMEPAA
jgi:2-dehydropantoate 2-reductase